ncbi:MAG: tetratricopeptide repeat protein [Mucilaginibacter sp.]
MKGQKTYLQAKAINEKLYNQYGHFSEIEKAELYRMYFNLLKKSAHLGHIESQYDYAQQFENISFLGVENPIYNPKKSIFWYTKACNSGHAEACNNLAHLYEKGEGCEKDLNISLKLYKQSAVLGSPNGEKNYKIMIQDLDKGGKYNK